MKRIALYTFIFVTFFIISYLSMCYLIPGMRIKLAAGFLEYFAESIKYMALFKCIVSFLIAFLVSSALLFISRK